MKPLTDVDFFGVDLVQYADIAYAFMCGIPSRGGTSMGWSMMGPDELKNQRWTFVKYWLNRLKEDRKAVNNS